MTSSVIYLSTEQQASVNCEGHALVTACPGSGKTRVLTCRLIRGLGEIPSRQHRVVALTFTNRAADEVKSRLDQADVPQTQLWAGTIHSFALEWILRPYAPYIERIRKGFSVADEYYTNKLLRSLKKNAGKGDYFEVNVARDRFGVAANANLAANRIANAYRKHLCESRLLDFDDILYCAYTLLADQPEIAQTLGHIISLVCVDEVQDTQDLQYGILARIACADAPCPTFFFVGDPDQSIYESLGAVTKNADEIKQEFGIGDIQPLSLTGNYRSSQRMIDYYRAFRPGVESIEALSPLADSRGQITFFDQTLHKDDLAQHISQLINDALAIGIPEREICVLAPHWWHVRSVARDLTRLLPDVDFDAPGLSPLHAQRDNLWFKIARIFLTAPEPRLYRTRLRWAGEVLRDLEEMTGSAIELGRNRARRFLRLTNSITSSEEEGLSYLRSVFSDLMGLLMIETGLFPRLSETYDLFFEKAEARIADPAVETPTDIGYLRKVFKHPSGVVVSTCHGVKGEEYDTVICFGLLKGYIPNWRVVINGTDLEAHSQAAKLLYVVCSRAKRHLHLIAESGRTTKRGNLYETTQHLNELEFDYDAI